ncbi:hypothetical protein CC2G_000066 [Coprinopsis cinerea AmutBmut pab1-1]|nr:hypothetical protein CC2G_000066 [Coprinopsis cinerea AmutBmut pab1-1]
MLSKSFIALAALIASTSALPRKRQVDNGPTEGWEDVGCYTDSAVPRTLIDASFADAEMTPALCTAFCEAGGYGFAGVEYGLVRPFPSPTCSFAYSFLLTYAYVQLFFPYLDFTCHQ